MAIKITGPIGQGGAGGAVTSVNGATGAVNLYADNATLNLAGDGIVVNGAGATSTLDVDSGTTAGKIVKLDGSARLPPPPSYRRPSMETIQQGQRYR